MKKLLALTVICAGLVSFAETYTVTSGADSGEGTLRALLASVASDDVIVIPANMTITLETTLILPRLNVTIRGNGETSVVSGNDAVQLIEVKNGSYRYVFENLVLERGFSETGGAGFKWNSATGAVIVMNDCIVRDMHVTTTLNINNAYYRGVLMQGGNSTLEFYATNTVFTGLWGGCAIASVGNNYGVSHLAFVLSDCKIINNGDASGHPGFSTVNVGMASGSQGFFDKCIFAGNVSSNVAAIAYNGSSDSSARGLLFRDCVFTNNVSTIGAGMFNFAYGRNVFENCTISDNTAYNNALYNEPAKSGYGVEFRNCLIERNRTTEIANAYNKAGLFFLEHSAKGGYDEVMLFSNTVIRSNYSSCSYLMATEIDGGVVRFVDSEISDNVIRGIKIMNSMKTNVFTRCAIVRNYSDPAYTTESSSGIISGQYSAFDNCLLASNDIRRARHLFAGKGAFVGCTAVSNTCASSDHGYPALKPNAGSLLVDTVVLGSTRSTNHTTVENDISCVNAPAVTNCYFERVESVGSAVGTGIVTGKSMADLGLQWELVTDRSNTRFLDGSRMPAMVFTKGSPLQNAGVWHPDLGNLDIVRGARKPNRIPDIGCWEFPEVAGMVIIYR